MVKECQLCGTPITIGVVKDLHMLNRSKFCSLGCYRMFHSRLTWHTNACHYCHGEFITKNKKSKYCCKTCRCYSSRNIGFEYKSGNGYIYVRVPNEIGVSSHMYQLKHRMVAEGKIGRSLRDGEVVHHINGCKTDNRPENIEVLASNSEHAMLHHLSRKAAGVPPPWNRAEVYAKRLATRRKNQQLKEALTKDRP